MNFVGFVEKRLKKGHYDPTNIFYGCPGGEQSQKKTKSMFGMLWITTIMFLDVPFPMPFLLLENERTRISMVFMLVLLQQLNKYEEEQTTTLYV